MAEYNVGTVEITLKTKMDEATKTASSLLVELRKLKNEVKATKGEIDSTSKSSKKIGGDLKKAFSVGKFYVALNYIRRYSQALSKSAKMSVDYLETMNKFEVSMDRMFGKAIKFQNELKETFGLSKSELMDYQANFNNIVKAMGGVTDEQAYDLSEKLTEISLDFASLFNTSTADAMAKIQAALTQQVRPIRSVSGFDITQATLGTVLKDIGITDRTVQQLSQVEKRLLTIIALQRQMEAIGARGDLAKTIEQPANQLKVMQQTLKDLMIIVGNFTMYSLKPVLKYVNGILMAIEKIFVYAYTMLPNKDEKTKFPSLDDVLQTDNAIGGIGNAKKKVQELKRAVTGIDELNIISPQTEPDGGGGVGGLGGVDPRLLQAMRDYENQMKGTQMEATRIRDRILEWLGFTKDVDQETGEVNFNLKEGLTNFEKLRGLNWDLMSLASGGVGFGFGFASMFEPAQKNIKGAWELTKKFYNFLKDLTWEDIKEAPKRYFEWHMRRWEELKEKVPQKLQELQEKIVNWFDTLPERIGEKYGRIVGVLEGWDDKIKAQVFEDLNFAWESAKAWFDSLPEKISATWQEIKIGLGSLKEKAKAWIDEELPRIIDKVLEWFSPSKIKENFKAVGRNIGRAIKEGFFGKIQDIVDFFTAYKKGRDEGYESVTGVSKGYATGGFPTRGDYFLANENGVPEYVGSIGGKTAVANTNQIVDGISTGVYKANTEQNRLLQEQNTYLRQIASKEFSTYLDGRKVSNQLKKTEDGRGFNAVVGGFAYG